MAMSKFAALARVFLDGKEIEDGVRVISVSRVCGSRRFNTARFEVARVKESLEESAIEGEVIASVNHKPCVISLDVDGEKKGKIVHVGKVVATKIEQDRNERLVVESRLEPHDFGDVLTTVKCVSSFEGGTTGWRWKTTGDTDLGMVFNPLADGRPFPNMTWSAPDDRPIGKDGNVFVLQDQVKRVDIASALPVAYLLLADYPNKTWRKTLKPAGVDYWTLTDAAYYLMNLHLHSDEWKLPTKEDLAKILGDDPMLLRDHKLRAGQFFPKLFDDLLHPYGYDWFVDFRAVKGKNKEIKIFRRGEGDKVTLKQPEYGGTVDWDKLDVARISVQSDISSRAANAVRVRGDLEEVEATFILVPTWDASYDTRQDTDLTHEKLAESSELHRVYRDWAANEAGDYTGLRDWISTPYITEIVGDDYALYRRRRAYPTISTDFDGRPVGKTRGVDIEWWDGANWQPIDTLADGASLNIKLLKDEIGIRIDASQLGPIVSHGVWGDATVAGSNKVKGPAGGTAQPWTSPEKVGFALGVPSGWSPLSGGTNTSGLLFRMTCTVKLDRCVEYVEEPGKGGFKKGDYFLLDRKELVINARDRFRKRTVRPLSKYHKDRPDGVFVRRPEVDDTDTMKDVAEEVFATSNQSSLSGSIVQPGVGYLEHLGKVVEEIEGRDIDLRVSPKNRDKKYPSVVGVDYDVQGQTTTLRLDIRR